ISAVPRASDDLAWLFYTSGTTGRPKGAMLTHRVLSVLSHAYAAEVDPITPGNAIVHAAPMSHGSGLYIMAYMARLRIHVVPASGGFELAEVFRLFDRWPRASMFAAPTMVKRLVEAGSDCDPNNVRTIIWGGAPMYVEDALRALNRFGPRLAQIYGQGESPMTITTLSRRTSANAAIRAGRRGSPPPDVRLPVSRGSWRMATTPRCRPERQAKTSVAATGACRAIGKIPKPPPPPFPMGGCTTASSAPSIATRI